MGSPLLKELFVFKSKEIQNPKKLENYLVTSEIYIDIHRLEHIFHCCLVGSNRMWSNARNSYRQMSESWKASASTSSQQ